MAHPIQKFIYFIRLGRPLFLVGGFLFHGLGIMMALYEDTPLNITAVVWGQLVITSMQLMTHYSNDYFDLEADKANQTPTQWSGGSRVLPKGLLPPPVALAAAVFLAIIALAGSLIIGFVLNPGSLAMPLLFLALFLSWSYSSPPLRLHTRGMGELTVAIIVPGLTPLIGFYLQKGQLTLLPFLAVFPLCCLQFAMLLSINFPDAAGDAFVGKRTLVVQLGGGKAARLYIASLLLAYLVLPLLVWMGLPPLAATAVSLSGPLAIWQIWLVYRGAWARASAWNRLALGSIGLLIGTAVSELAAFYWKG